MATIQENLNTLSEIKTDIKTAIINKGVDAGDDITVYGDKIREISGGEVDDTDYLCLEAIEDNEISCGLYGTWTGPISNLEYSFDKKTWTDWGDYTTTSISMTAGQKIYLRGDNPNGFCESSANYLAFGSAATINISGNVMTLIDKTGESKTIINEGGLKALFRYAVTVDASQLKLPATTLSTYCYQFMFRYNELLIAAPELPATTLAEGCYSMMFLYCSALKAAPYLPAKTLVGNCYYQMFGSCSSLQYIKAEFTTAPNTSYTNNWVTGVPSTGCFIKAKNATWTTKATYGCPTGWTLITSVS